MASIAIHVLTILGALTTPLFAVHPTVRHTGRGHPHPKVRREAEGSSQTAGVDGIISPSSIVPKTISSSARISLQNPVLPISTDIDILITTMSPPVISSYAFPLSVIQVAVATNCPGVPSSSAIFPILPTDLASNNATNTTSSPPPIITSYLPVFVNATMLLPNGSSVVFMSISTSTVTSIIDSPQLSPQPTKQPSAETARIILDGDGCQTVYTATTIPVCETTLRLPGILPVPITDCDQWVTFSSQNLGACSSTGSASLQAGEVSNSTPKPPTPLVPASPITAPVVFYVAHWYELARELVPNIVEIQNCLPGMAGDPVCQTSSETWSTIYDTRVITTSSVASFSGVGGHSFPQAHCRPRLLSVF